MFKTVTTAIVTAALLAGCGQTPAAQDSAPSATTAAAPLTTPVEVLGITSHPYWAPAHVEVVDGKVQITSAPGVGAFTAELPLPEAARHQGPGRVQLHTKAVKGNFEITAVRPDDFSKVLAGPINAGELGKETVVELNISDLGAPATLLFANATRDGASTVIVSAVEVVQP